MKFKKKGQVFFLSICAVLLVMATCLTLSACVYGKNTFAFSHENSNELNSLLDLPLNSTDKPSIFLHGNSTGKEISSGSYVNERVQISSNSGNFRRLYYKIPSSSNYLPVANATYLTPAIQGWYYAYVENTDGAVSETVTFYFDDTAPEGILSLNGTAVKSGSYINDNFSYSATDTGSGVTEYCFKTPTSGIYQQYVPGTVINKNSGDGWYYFYCKDRSGNLSSIASVYLETSAPIVNIYRNGELKYTQTVASAGTYETDLYFNVGDTFKIICDTSSGKVTTNYVLNTNITVTSYFSQDFDIRLTNATGITSVFKVHVVKEMPKLVIEGTSYYDGTTLYFNTDKTVSWAYDSVIVNPLNSGVSVNSSGNKNIDEYISHSTATKNFTLTTDAGTRTDYRITISDAAGNKAICTVVINKKAPIGIIKSNGRTLENGGYTNKPVCVEFDEEGVTAQYSVNGGEYKSYTSGQLFIADATYFVLLTDPANNKTSYTVTVDTVAPIGQLYAEYAPVENGAVTNKKIYFSWDGELSCTVNGNPYIKNTVLTDDAEYTFMLTDFAGNSSTYRITVDTVCPSYNADRLAGDVSYKISKWYVVAIDGENYSFATYDEALTYASGREFERAVTVLHLENVEDFKQSHLVASNGNPDNHADEVRTGEYWLYKSKANPGIHLYYFDRDLLNEVLAYYAKDTVSHVRYYDLNGDKLYGTPSDSMSDNLLTAADGTLAPAGNNFVFEKADSAEVYAELVGVDGTHTKVAFEIPFGQQFFMDGLYKITEIDEAKNETIYYLYLDLCAPELKVSATIYGNNNPTELTITKDSLEGIAVYYYESFDVCSISDVDKWSVLTVTNNDKTSYYTFGDELPVLNVGGEYLLWLYDRSGNAYSFTVYIVGNPAEIAFKNNYDDTAFEVTITLEQAFDTIVALEIRRNGVLLSNITTDVLTYTFDRAGIYTVSLRDNFGRVIAKEYTFTLSLDTTAPTVILNGVENGGVADGIVTITEPSEPVTVEVYKNGERIDYELGQELSEYGDYRVVVTDSAGNITEYHFTLKHLLNGGAVALIVIGILAIIGAALAAVILRKKGVFGKKKPLKKDLSEPSDTDSKKG